MFQALGVRMRHVPYKVGPTLMQDLVAGRVSALIAGVFTAAPFVPSGRLKVLAVSGAQRQPALPKAPTFAEAGYPGIDLRTFCGMAAPRGTPAEIVSRIQQQVRASLFTPDYQEKVGAPFGYAPVGSTPAEFTDALQRRRETVQQLIKKLGLRLE